jgi:hypothetical protein
MVAAPPAPPLPAGVQPPAPVLPRARTVGRRFTTEHPSTAFESGLPPGLRPNRRAVAPDGTTVFEEHSAEAVQALMIGQALKKVARPTRLTYEVWPDEFALDPDPASPFAWHSTNRAVVQSVVEEGIDRVLRERLADVLRMPTELARTYGPVGVNLFTLHLQGPMLHVIGQPYDPANYWGIDAQAQQAIAAMPGGGLPGVLPVSTRIRLSTEVNVRKMHGMVERADVLRAATASLTVFGLHAVLPEVPADANRFPNGLPPRTAFEPGFAEWLRTQLVLDGRATADEVKGTDVAAVLERVQNDDANAWAYYGALYLSALTTDIWPLWGEVDGINVTLRQPSVTPMTDAGLVPPQPATGPAQHAAFRLRIAFDSAFGDGNFRFYIVPGVDPFMNLDVTKRAETSAHAAWWLDIVAGFGEFLVNVLRQWPPYGEIFGAGDRLFLHYVGPVGQRISRDIAARAGEASDIDGILEEGLDSDSLPGLAELAASIAGVSATPVQVPPGLVVRDVTSDPVNGTVVDLDFPPDENSLRRPNGSPGGRTSGDGMVEPLSTYVLVEGRPTVVTVTPVNRWLEGPAWDVWLGCELQVEAETPRAAFVARPGVFPYPSFFLMMTERAIEAAVDAGELVPVDRLDLAFPSDEGDAASTFWAIRLGLERPTWLLGVSASPRLPVHGADEVRAGLAARARREVAEAFGTPPILDLWAAIEHASLGALDGRPLGVPTASVNGFVARARATLGPWLAGGNHGGGAAVLALTPRDITRMLGDTIDEGDDLTDARSALAGLLRKAGDDDVTRAIAEGDWKALGDPEGIAMPAEDVRALKDEVAVRERALAASLADVLQRYDVRARPEHWIRAVSAPMQDTTVRVEGVASLTDRVTRPSVFDDRFAIRTYRIYPHWTVEFRLYSIGYDPSTMFEVRGFVEGIDGHDEVLFVVPISSVDLSAVGLPAGSDDLRRETVSETQIREVVLPDDFPPREPVNGRDHVRIEVSVNRRVVATASLSIALVESVSVEYTAAGRALRDRVAGQGDRQAMRRMRSAFAEPRSWFDDEPEFVPTNPSVDDKLGHLAPRPMPAPPPPPPPIPPRPASGRRAAGARDFDPLDLVLDAESIAWLRRFSSFGIRRDTATKVTRPPSGPLFRIDR